MLLEKNMDNMQDGPIKYYLPGTCLHSNQKYQKVKKKKNFKNQKREII
jgi:hypothetical protein